VANIPIAILCVSFYIQSVLTQEWKPRLENNRLNAGAESSLLRGDYALVSFKELEAIGNQLSGQSQPPGLGIQPVLLHLFK
jgi:hypothetical protein